MGNTLASVALFAWPVVVIVLFRRLPAAQALAVSVVGGYLLLPTEPNYNLPLLPTYGKNLAAVLPALVMAFVLSRPGPRGAPPAVACRPGWIPRSPLVRVCLAAILAGACMTVLTNGDALAYPLQTLPGLRPYDAAASILSALTALLPFLLARKFLARSEDHATLLAVLAVAALAYTLPALWEVRMSPRLNAEIYGFFPHDWRQHLRAGGYRPVVFLEHGLRLGLFLAIGILAMGVTLRLVHDRRRGDGHRRPRLAPRDAGAEQEPDRVRDRHAAASRGAGPARADPWCCASRSPASASSAPSSRDELRAAALPRGQHRADRRAAAHRPADGADVPDRHDGGERLAASPSSGSARTASTAAACRSAR